MIRTSDDNPRVALIGAPVDEGAGAEGALMGPAALRVAGLPQMLRDLGCDVQDRGDLAMPADGASGLDDVAHARSRNAGLVAGWTRAIHDATFAALQDERLPVVLGGDHSLSMGSVTAVARHCAARNIPLAVLWLDAHADFNTPETSPSGNMHGMSVAMVCGDDALRPLLGGRPLVPVDPRRVHLFGLRSVDHDERERVMRAGIEAVDMRRIDEFGVSALMRQMLERAGAERPHLHVSLDVDFLDPSIAPAVGTTVPGGATYREAHLIMEMLHDSGLVGSLDIVELNPFLDERGRSARLLAELTASLFGRTVIDRARAARRG
ncbi:MAG: arginase [Methylobacteriaceae bacterium]|nr:arginase [Methylobacteriaceae bacterium]